jgi:hypothetical protein
MKLRQLRQKLYRAIFNHDSAKEKKVWFKILKKSTKHKHTEDIR